MVPLSGLLVPCGAEAWYRSYRYDSTGTKVPIYTLSKGAVRTVPHGTLMPVLRSVR